VTRKAEIVVPEAPIAEGVRDQFASVLVDCIEGGAGGASVSFMPPLSLCYTAIFWKRLEPSS